MKNLIASGKTVLVDPEDYDKFSKYNWSLRDGYVVNIKKTNHKATTIILHRAILDVPQGLQTDHINGDKLDNRKNNLRACTPAQNQMNQHSRRGNSGYKGVCWHSYNKTYHARIWINGANKHLGYFSKEIDAAQAYDRAALKYFGEFANINFPDRGKGRK